MGQVEKARNFVNAHKTLLTIIAIAVLGLAFIGSICLSIFIGGEFVVADDLDKSAKGVLKLNDSQYQTRYFSGETFVFDKETSKITLIAKDPLIDTPVKVENLPASEYGFRVNGEGDVIFNPSDIVMTEDITTVDLVSRVYPNLSVPIDVQVFSAIDESTLVNSVTLEAENAKLYMDDALLSDEDKRTKREDNGPFLSSADSNINADAFSGGAVLQKFGKQNMRVEFEIACTKAVTVQVTVKVCRKATSAKFSTGYKCTLNGAEFTSFGDKTVSAGERYATHSLAKVSVKLERGVNVLAFSSGDGAGTSDPFYFDAIVVEAGSGERVLAGGSAAQGA